MAHNCLVCSISSSPQHKTQNRTEIYHFLWEIRGHFKNTYAFTLIGTKSLPANGQHQILVNVDVNARAISQSIAPQQYQDHGQSSVQCHEIKLQSLCLASFTSKRTIKLFCTTLWCTNENWFSCEPFKEYNRAFDWIETQFCSCQSTQKEEIKRMTKWENNDTRRNDCEMSINKMRFCIDWMSAREEAANWVQFNRTSTWKYIFIGLLTEYGWKKRDTIQ